MHKLLYKWLNQKGFKGPEELDKTPMPDGSPNEFQIFENYREILSKEELTIDDFRQFMQGQVSVIEGKWSDLNIEQSKKAELIPYHTVYKILLQALDAPKTQKEILERQLIQLTK